MICEHRAYAFNELRDAIETRISVLISPPEWDRLDTGDVGKRRYVIMLVRDRDIPYKQTPFPAGVTSIPANTDTCPCCKRKLEVKK